MTAADEYPELQMSPQETVKMPIIDLNLASLAAQYQKQRFAGIEADPAIATCAAINDDGLQTTPERQKRPKSTNVEEISFLIPSPEKQRSDKLLCSGPVHRYRPGFANEPIFVPRFLQVTESLLNYYVKEGSIEPLF